MTLQELDVKTMRLRYAGICEICGCDLPQGERAHYLRASKTVRCLNCGVDAEVEPAVTAGRSAAEQAAREEERAARLAAKQRDAERRAAALAAGAEGERLVAEALAPLSAAGYVVLHDRAAGPRANLDHIVVGPSGVWLVNAKHWSGTVTVDDTLRQSGRSQTRMLERALQECELVTETLAAESIESPVRTVLAFTSSGPDEPARLRGVELTPVGALRSVIGSAEPLLDGRGVDRAVGALLTAFPPAGETEHAPSVDEDELPDDLRDPAAYLFVEPWSRYGKRRLYLHRFGSGFGYVDLDQRTVHVESDHERAQDNLEFVLEWFSDVDAEPKRTGRLARLASWVAGRGPRRAVGVRFRRKNVDRLYVHLADGTSRTQVGYLDLLSGKVHAPEDEFAAIVAKAGAVRAATGSIR